MMRSVAAAEFVFDTTMSLPASDAAAAASRTLASCVEIEEDRACRIGS